jgi:hypothetical protein
MKHKWNCITAVKILSPNRNNTSRDVRLSLESSRSSDFILRGVYICGDKDRKQKTNSVVSVRKANYTDRATAACRRS